ncbi:kinetochore protein Spc24 [Genypterus blacodes]|uniref:kinetochore protein Spc24 n=1 Tax=Genypterus blacodes TaxID=154954 RepID=UPI003F758120
MAQSLKFQDLEETGEALVALIKSSQPEKLRQVKAEHKSLFDQHLETKRIVTLILKDVALNEERVSQRLLDMEEERKQKEKDLESLEVELRQRKAKRQQTDSEVQLLEKELDSLREAKHELEDLRKEMEEDTTVVLPIGVYIARMYHLITKIKWEYDTEPHILKGVHYGKELASPINIDTSTQTKRDVSNKLWDLISTDW